jgi:ABC-type branched-subunit amino acid transport system ATPase component
MTILLEAKEVVKDFGGLRAVDHCSIAVERGSICGLIGPNGAGKTTLFDLLTGFYKPNSGTVLFKDKRIDALEPHQICLQGLVRTFQIARELKNMTLLENMLLAPKGQYGEHLGYAIARPPKVLARERENLDRALGILEIVGLNHLKNEAAINLSGGQRKMLEVARALMTDPEMLLLDEPTAGATFEETRKLMSYIEDLRKDHGLTFLIVEHKMEVIMNLCDRIFVMNNGRKLTEGTPREVQRNPQVIEAYLGA